MGLVAALSIQARPRPSERTHNQGSDDFTESCVIIYKLFNYHLNSTPLDSAIAAIVVYPGMQTASFRPQ